MKEAKGAASSQISPEAGKPEVRCANCGMLGHVTQPALTSSAEVIMQKAKRISYQDYPDVYIYDPNVQMEPLESSPPPPSKMATPELIWSKASYSMTTLMQKYSEKFPIIVKVNSGYYGKYHIDTLASSQVARLHTWCMQDRVLARNSRGRMLSIPLEYEISFEVITKKNKKIKTSKPKKLRSIIHDHTLPVEVQFPKKPIWNFRIGSERHQTKGFGQLEIIKVYQQRYLKGNTIHNGTIDTKVMLLPMYINATFKVATGAKNQTEEEWHALQTMYSNAVKHIDFGSIKGSKDMYEYPSNLEPVKKEDLTDDENEDNRDETDANANVTTIKNREDPKPQMNGHVNTGVRVVNGHSNSMVDLRQNKSEVISIPLRHNMVMQVAKEDLESGRHTINGPDQRSLLRSDMSDYSSITGPGLRKSNVVRVSLGDDAQVITQEMYDRDFGHSRPHLRHQPPSINGSTIINVTNDDSHIILNHSLPSYNTMTHSETNLRRTFSDLGLDVHDNSVFLPNTTANTIHYHEEYPSYSTRRHYKQSFPSFSSSDVSRVPRYGRKKKYGQVLLGGAPMERQYHSMKDLSRIDMVDSGVSRVPSFRSATLTPSPSPSRIRTPNLHVHLTDDQPHDRFIKRIEFRDSPRNQVTYTRRVGMEPANRVAKQVRTRESSFNKGVYITDGNRNYHAKKRRAPPPPPPPPAYDTTDYIEVIEEDYTQAEPPMYAQPPMHSPVMSSSSTEDSRRYFIMYENGSHEEPIVKEATENGEFLYQGSMMLRKGRDFEQLSVDNESMIEIPVEDIRSRRRAAYSSSSMHEEMMPSHRVSTMHREETVPLHDIRSRNIRRSYAETVERQPITHGQRVERAEYINFMRGAYDEVDAEEEYVDVHHADMTKGTAEHWGRVMDVTNASSRTRHQVPLEVEGRSKGINQSMFEGGHHSFSHDHGLSHDRNVCRRLEAQRHERSMNHREHSLNLARMHRQGGHSISRSRVREPHTVVVNRTSAPFNAGISTGSYHTGGGGGSYVAGSSYEIGSSSGGIGSLGGMGSGGVGRDHSSDGYQFRSSRNEVWSKDDHGFGVAPMTTSEQETSQLLKHAERQESASPEFHHDISGHEVSKGSTSSYIDSSLDSSHDGEMGVSGEAAGGGGGGGAAITTQKEISTRSYNLTIDDVPIEHDEDPIPPESAGLAAAAAAAAMADGNLDIHSDERISRKMARELTRSGSVRSLREVYARSRSPSSSQRDKPPMAVAPASEVFADILNKPTTSNGSMNRKAETRTVTTTSKSVTSADGNVIMRNKAGRGAVGNAATSGVSREVNPGDNELAWQETQSYHLESIRDSIRDLDEYLKNQGAESDAQSLSSATSSKHLEHFSYALAEDPATY